jgi:large subunit ribosomal protein L33
MASEIITLVSTDPASSSTYMTRKNKKQNPERLERKKYCPVLRKHILFREKK